MRKLFKNTHWTSLIVWLGMSFNICLAENSLTIFSASWCGNCQTLKKALDENPDALKDYSVEFIDFDQNRKLARELKVRSIPTFILLDAENKEIARKVGFDNISELKAWLAKNT